MPLTERQKQKQKMTEVNDPMEEQKEKEQEQWQRYLNNLESKGPKLLRFIAGFDHAAVEWYRNNVNTDWDLPQELDTARTDVVAKQESTFVERWQLFLMAVMPFFVHALPKMRRIGEILMNVRDKKQALKDSKPLDDLSEGIDAWFRTFRHHCEDWVPRADLNAVRVYLQASEDEYKTIEYKLVEVMNLFRSTEWAFRIVQQELSKWKKTEESEFEAGNEKPRVAAFTRIAFSRNSGSVGALQALFDDGSTHLLLRQTQDFSPNQLPSFSAHRNKHISENSTQIQGLAAPGSTATFRVPASIDIADLEAKRRAGQSRGKSTYPFPWEIPNHPLAGADPPHTAMVSLIEYKKDAWPGLYRQPLPAPAPNLGSLPNPGVPSLPQGPTTTPTTAIPPHPPHPTHPSQPPDSSNPPNPPNSLTPGRPQASASTIMPTRPSASASASQAKSGGSKKFPFFGKKKKDDK